MSLFISIEGIEGAGKSTLRAGLAESLAALDVEVVVTREPGATNLGQTLRSILLDAARTEIDPVAELFLFYADRAQHLREVIRPALARGAVVLCDRYVHSTYAYQGYGRGLPLERLKTLTEIATEGLSPDLVLLLDLDVKQGLLRAEKRTRRASGTMQFDEQGQPIPEAAEESWNRFEQQKLEFHQRVRSGFLELAKDPQNKILILPAEQNAEALRALAFQEIKRKLPHTL